MTRGENLGHVLELTYSVADAIAHIPHRLYLMMKQTWHDKTRDPSTN